jgi:hypothetical protein
VPFLKAGLCRSVVTLDAGSVAPQASVLALPVPLVQRIGTLWRRAIAGCQVPLARVVPILFAAVTIGTLFHDSLHRSYAQAHFTRYAPQRAVLLIKLDNPLAVEEFLGAVGGEVLARSAVDRLADFARVETC